MKVLVCHNYYRTTSGEDIVIRADLDLMRAEGFEIVEYRRDNVETDAYAMHQYLRFAAATVYSRHTVRQIEQLVKAERPDVAFVQNVFPLISPSIYYALARLGVPVIQLVYNYRLVCPNATLYTGGQVCERCVGGNYFHAVTHRCFRNSVSLSALYAGTLAAHRHIGDLRRTIAAYITPDRFLRDKLVAAGIRPGGCSRSTIPSRSANTSLPTATRGTSCLPAGWCARKGSSLPSAPWSGCPRHVCSSWAAAKPKKPPELRRLARIVQRDISGAAVRTGPAPRAGRRSRRCWCPANGTIIAP